MAFQRRYEAILNLLWPHEISWSIDDGPVYKYSDNPQVVSLLPGNHVLNMFDSWGDGWNGMKLTMTDASGKKVITDVTVDFGKKEATHPFTTS